MVNFRKTWFNPLYFHLRKYIDDPKIRVIKIYGGKSSAKTFSVAQLLAILCYVDNCSAIAYRKESSTIKTTLKKTFTKAIDSLFMGDVWEMMDMKACCSNGSEIMFRGLDKEDKIKGIEGYKYLLMDELDHYSLEEWQQANFSLRGVEGVKLLATWNPVDENSWIKAAIDEQDWIDKSLIIDGMGCSLLDSTSFVRMSRDGSEVLIKTTYLDNKWMVGGIGFGFRDENLIKVYEDMRVKNENFYNVNVLGEWGVKDKNKKTPGVKAGFLVGETSPTRGITFAYMNFIDFPKNRAYNIILIKSKGEIRV